MHGVKEGLSGFILRNVSLITHQSTDIIADIPFYLVGNIAALTSMGPMSRRYMSARKISRRPKRVISK